MHGQSNITGHAHGSGSSPHNGLSQTSHAIPSAVPVVIRYFNECIQHGLSIDTCLELHVFSTTTKNKTVRHLSLIFSTLLYLFPLLASISCSRIQCSWQYCIIGRRESTRPCLLSGTSVDLMVPGPH